MNYETNKIIFVCYPPGSGGKFVINCLGVSNHAVLQHQHLINYTTEQKQTFLLNKLSGQDGPWNDLGLGCNELLGDIKLSGTLEHGAILGKLEVGLPFNETGIKLSNQKEKDFFYVCHDEDTRYNNIKIFPNAKQILFTNCNNFLSKRPSHNMWKDVEWHSETGLNWDTDWFEDISATVDGIKSFYSKLDYTDFDNVKEWIKDYYKLWIQKIR